MNDFFLIALAVSQMLFMLVAYRALRTLYQGQSELRRRTVELASLLAMATEMINALGDMD